ncbi:hypothetical protein ABT56_11140 [Photobacterium aquae]|uniref:Uncharacterized protein n=1 Tax=Photobacterium aquae TaxID=1195763 RepID=A0A0J1H1C5_9GAMM|nr:hypothetical protein ABT56_11140 [Photobacterium aquae]
MNAIPKEIAIGDIYLPPLLVAGFLGVVCTSLTARLLNKLQWHRYVASPPLAELCIAIVYTVLIGTYVFPS